jgi:hypothetical protein
MRPRIEEIFAAILREDERIYQMAWPDSAGDMRKKVVNSPDGELDQDSKGGKAERGGPA